MPIPRIHLSQPLGEGMDIHIDGQPARHLIQVLRLREGDEVCLFNGDGHDYPASLTAIRKRDCTASIHARSDAEPALTLDTHLGIGISKGERMDFAVQKAVELGVGAITPLITERSVVRLSGERLQKKTDHWQGVLIAACEQSGRRRLPELNAPVALEQWLATHEPHRCLGLMFDHRAEHTLATLAPPTALELLVGPEGGLSGQERKMAAERGFTAVRMGPRVLRTETAPLAALAAAQTLWGDFRD